MEFQDQIQENMPVVGSDSADIGTVDHLDAGQTIKLVKDESGIHHWIPIAWVVRVDDQVHLDRPSPLVKEEWADSSPADLH